MNTNVKPGGHGGSRRVAIVTGAARGLGAAMALGLVDAGIDVAAFDLPDSDGAMQELAARSRPSDDGVYHPVHADVRDYAACAAAVDAVVARFGRLDILVNNAGIGMNDVLSGDRYQKFYEQDPTFWPRLIDVNLNGAFRMARIVTPHLVARGAGRIVNVTTSFATMVEMGMSPYGPAKAGLEAATVIWAKELSGSGVTVNVLVPGGPADTRLVPAARVKNRAALIRPEIMAAPLRWLVSPAAAEVTGRRYVAKLWDENLPTDQAAAAAGAAAGWG
jgi:NAD(P)-dependent dehydrogenase (short-subunit alcohol dehydrogenase family)